MLLAHYLPKIITALFGGLFIFAGIYTFGNALLFDRIFIGVLIFTAIVCRKNVNVLGVVIILMGVHLLSEAAWFVSELEYKTTAKIGFYCLSGVVCYQLRYDYTSKILLACLIGSLLSEGYWEYLGKNAPEIYWYIFVLSSNLIARHLLFLRVSYTDDFFPGKSQSINMDWHLYKLTAVAAILQSFNILEYIVRSVFGFVEVMFIYNIYPYLMQAISTYTVWIIFHESYKLLLPKLLRA